MRLSSHRFIRVASAAALMALWAGTAVAQARVQTELVAEKLVRQPSGQLSAVAANDAKPGDLVVYTATYRNVGNQPARAVLATVPVPAGMEWQGAAGHTPAPTLASTDGVTYAPVPLTRKVRTADNKEQQQPVPLSEYRYLRWSLTELPAGANLSVKVTAKVTTNP